MPAPRFVLACLVGAVTASACARPPPSLVLRVAVATAPESLDPRFATSATAVRLSQLVAPPLCVVGDDLRARPVVARTITRVDDVTVDAVLADRVMGDGRVEAADVVFTFSSVQDAATRSPHRARLATLRSVVALDDRTVRFVTSGPHAPFVVDVLCGIGIVSRRACAGERGLERCRMAPVGAGAWRVDPDGVVDDRVLLRRVDGPGGARVDLDVRVVRDGTARLLALVGGDIDVIAGDVAPWDVDALPDDMIVHARPGLGLSYLGINARAPPLSDDRVRRAIAHAIDVDGLLRARMKGHARRAAGLLPPDHWANDPALTPLAFDVNEARRLLREAGVSPGTRIRLLCTPDRLRRSLALAIRDQLAAVDLVIDVVIRDWSVVYEELKSGRFDLVLARWTPVVEPDLLTTTFHSRSIPAPDRPGGNRGGFVDTDIDAWLDEARATLDDAARAALVHRVLARARARVPLLPLWFDDEIVLAGPRVRGLVAARTGALWPLADVTLAEPP